MPKTKAAPAKASKAAVVVDDEEEEEEIVTTKPAKASKANGKVAPAKKKATEEGPYTPNKNSQRDFVMRAMKKGGSSTQIKKRAATLAEKAKVKDLADPKAYKAFDVAYFAKFLQGKGYSVEIDEENDSYTLSA